MWTRRLLSVDTPADLERAPKNPVMINAVITAKRVAFQGEPGAYANLAAHAHAVPHAGAIPKPTFEDAIEAARSGDCDLCIIPVENSLIGRIADIHHLLPDSGLHIVGEHFLPIRHQLLGLKEAVPGRHQKRLQPGAGAGPVPRDSARTRN